MNCYKCTGMQLDILRSLRNKHSFVTLILFPGKSSQMCMNKDLCRRVFSSALFTKLRHWEASQRPTGGDWLKKIYPWKASAIEDYLAVGIRILTELGKCSW